MDSLSTEQAVLKIMETPEGRENAYLCYYEWDINSAYQRFLESEEWEAVKSLLSKYRPPTMKALDLGAGNGIGSYALFKLGYSVTSLEPDSSELVGYGALNKYKKIEFVPIFPVSGFGENLPFKNKTFGLVYVRQTLHHAVDLYKMMREISRVLVPGGVFIATREHIVDDKASLNIFLENHALHKYTHSEGAFLLDQYLKALKESNFKLKKLILSWDSIINHFPNSNEMVQEQFRKKLNARFGPLGSIFAKQPKLVEIYRRRKSHGDHRPGRMISFVARAI
jgi:ubiquinone/menaquinone biosynthesis C-methylase UbiE